MPISYHSGQDAAGDKDLEVTKRTGKGRRRLLFFITSNDCNSCYKQRNDKYHFGNIQTAPTRERILMNREDQFEFIKRLDWQV